MKDESAVQPNEKIPLPGSYLLIAGSALHFRSNHLMKHLPGVLEPFTENLDVMGSWSAYNGPDRSRIIRLLLGFWNIFRNPKGISTLGNARVINGRRLHLPVILHWMIQDIWLYWVLRKELRPRYEIVIAGGPDSVLFAWFLKKFGRVGTVVYYDYDYFPYVHDYRGYKKLVRYLVDLRERIGLKLASEIVSVSRPLVELRQRQGAALVSLIPNGVDVDRFTKAREDSLGDRSPTIIYTGTIDERWGIDLAIDAMPQILRKFPGARLIIVGEGPDEGNLKQRVARLELDGSVEFMGKRPYDELPKIMANADIGVASSRPDIFRFYASPLKLVEYMAAGLAVICSGGGEAEMMVNESGAGTNIEFSADQFAEAAIMMLSEPDVMQQLRTKGMQYAQSRSWNCVGEKLFEVLERHADPS